MGCKVYLPTIHLFAYSRGKKSENSLEVADNIDPNWLWEQCNQIVKTKLPYGFDLKDFLQEENTKVEAELLINQELSKAEKPDFIHIPVDRKIHSYDIEDYFPISIQQGNNIKAEIYPLRLYQSYALGLSFYPPQQLKNKKLSIDEIIQQNINPNNCLFLSEDKNNPFIGQTILITAKLTGKDRKKSLAWLKENVADQYLEALFNKDTNFRKPAFNRAGKSFGRPIFEYGIYRQLDNYIHVLVWLLSDKEQKSIVEKNYSKLLDLFFFRTRIIYAYKETRKHLGEAKKNNFTMEKKLEKMFTDPSEKDMKEGLRDLNLAEISGNLIELTQMSVSYANILRDIEEHQNAIVNNTRNYSDKIKEIRSFSHNESLGFFSFFGERTCRSFKEQLAAELGYFQHGIDLVDNVVDALRGLVAIEQTNRERELQSTIIGLGFGMTAAGNLASSYEAGAFPDEENNNPLKWSPFDWTHFGSSLVLSLVFGLFVWRFASNFFENWYKERQLVKENQTKLRWFRFWRNKKSESDRSK